MDGELALTADIQHLKSCREEWAGMDPDYRIYASQFERVIHPYFPHLKGEVEACAFELNWLETGILRNPTTTYRHSYAKVEILKLRKAVKALADLDLGYWLKMAFAINPKIAGGEAASDGVQAIHDLIGSLGFRLIHNQNATSVASATADRKFLASLS